MTELIRKNVTLLFTDIEGSTRLLQRLGESYPDVLAKHRELLHNIYQLHDGHEVSWQGDSSFVVFADPEQAVAAAVDVQRDLYKYSWPSNGVVRVRIGLHTGKPIQTEDDYTGVDVHYAARLMAAASGGQILLSETVLDAIDNDWPSGIKVLSLGRHQLKDMAQAENIYQLSIDGLPSEFPRIKAIDLRPNNLPSPVTPLVGRKEEVFSSVKLLRNPHVRMVTFTGSGGTGKTRLSLQVAADLLGDFEDGVFFVALAAIQDSSLVIPAIAHTLGANAADGHALSKNLEEFLKEKQLLLVLDNFEQVVEAASAIAELLAACPKLKILITSRMALRLSGEHELPVPPLELPDLEQLPLLRDLSQVASVELFTQRAQAAKSSFSLNTENASTVATICTRLEGLPLAIELAAPHLRTLPPENILARLEKGLTLLTDGARDLPSRHQTLRECIAWSFNLLQPNEQELFRRLAIFTGGFTLAAADTILCVNAPSPIESLEVLERVNLIKRGNDDADNPRFIMLERIREFAVEQLESEVKNTNLQCRHADFYLNLAQTAAEKLTGREQSRWLQQLDQEQHNLRAALNWTLQYEPETALRLAGAMCYFWEIRGWLAEGRRWLSDTLAINKQAPDALRAHVLSNAGRLAWHEGDYSQSLEFLEESLALHIELGDNKNIATDKCRLALAAVHLGDLARAETLLKESLAISRILQDKAGMLQVIVELQEISLQSDIDNLRTLSEEGLSLAHELGNERARAGSLMNLGFAEHYVGNYEEAYELFAESLRISRQLGENWYATHALYALGKTLTAAGKWEEAFPYLQQALEMVYEFRYLWSIPYMIATFGYVAAVRGYWNYAVQLLGKVQAMCDAAGTPLMPECGREYASYVSRARLALGEADFTESWNQGMAMAEDEAIQRGLAAAGPLPPEKLNIIH